MAGTSLLTLLDDIASILDDVATLTKVATKKTAGVLGDDLALNAQQVTGVASDRELPVVWAVAKGSAINKLILVPAALAISAFAPWAVTPLLMAGGAFLCFEGFEKVLEKLLHREEHGGPERLLEPPADPVAAEKDKIRGAIRTDFILSAEIVVITLGAVAGATFGTRVGVLAAVSALMTVGVYGLVAGIVKLDDGGLALSRRADRPMLQRTGAFILRAAPVLMKGLGIAGTAAMFLVGGSIVGHGVPPLFHLVEDVVRAAGGLGALVSLLADALVGLATGAVVFGAVVLVRKLRGRPAAA